MKSHIAVFRHDLEPEQNVGLELLFVGFGDGGSEQGTGAVQDDAGGISVGVLEDVASTRDRSLPSDAGALESHPVAPHPEAVKTDHDHRVVGNFLANKLHGRVTVGPGSFVPATRYDPFAIGNGGRLRGGELDGFFLGLDTDQVDFARQRSQLRYVPVGVDETRQDGGPLDVQYFSGIALIGLCFLAGANEKDSIAYGVSLNDHIQDFSTELILPPFLPLQTRLW